MVTSARILAFSFLAGIAASASGCIAPSGPVFEASADRTLTVPEALSKPGTQARVLLPGERRPILVWRTEIGFGATEPRCSCDLGSELRADPAKGILECSGQGCRFKLDGSVLSGPAEKPLRAYLVDLQGDRLRILG